MSTSRLLCFRFQPTDQELLGHYLYRKLDGTLPMEDQAVIPEYDLYGEEEPSQIWGGFGGDKLQNEDLYFFTHLKKKKDSHRVFERKVGVNGGKWHGEDSGSPVKVAVAVDGEGKVIVEGCRKRFNYRNPGSGQDRAWIMHEYSLHCHDHLVVCRLRKNDKVNAKNNKLKRSSCSNVEQEQVHAPNPKRIKRAEAVAMATEAMPPPVVEDQSSETTTEAEINGGVTSYEAAVENQSAEELLMVEDERSSLSYLNEIASHFGNGIDDDGIMMMGEDQVVYNTNYETTNYYHQDEDDFLMMNPYNSSSSSSEMAMVVEDDHQFHVEQLLLSTTMDQTETTITTELVAEEEEEDVDLWNLISIDDEQDVGGLSCWEQDLLYTTNSTLCL